MASSETFNPMVTEAPYLVTLDGREFGIYLVLNAESTELTEDIREFTVEVCSPDYQYKNYFKFSRVAQGFASQARIIFDYDRGDGIEPGDQVYILRDGSGRIIWKTTSL